MKKRPMFLPCLITTLILTLTLHSSGVVIQDTQTLGLNVPQGTLGTGSFVNVTAQVGDVIVLTAAGNKRGTVITLSANQVGGTGGADAQTPLSNALATYPNSFGWYQTVTNAGTFDFDVTTDNTNGLTAVLGLYVLRGNGGSIALMDSATWDDNDNADNGTAYSLNYTFASAVTNAVLVESISSRTDLVTPPAAYTIDRSGGDKRILASEEGITGSAWGSDYSLSGGTANRQTSGALGMVFAEGTEGGGPVSIPPDDTNIVFQGSQYITKDPSGAYSQRHSDAVLGLPVGDLGFNATKARTTTGIAMLFRTVSSSITVDFTHEIGTGLENRGSTFAVYEDGQFLGTHFFNNAASNLSFTVHSASPGTASVFRIVFPNWSKPDFRGLELDAGASLLPVALPSKNKYVAFGDSISHGTGQASTYLTYPWILAELLDLDLCNLAVGGGKVSVPAAEMLSEFPPVDVITLLIGYNDLHGAGKTAAQYAVDLNAMIEAVRTNQPTADLFCISPTFTTNLTNSGTGETMADFRQAVYDAVSVRQAGGDVNIHLIRGEDLTSATNLNDKVHLSEPGAQYFAEQLAAHMGPIVDPVVSPYDGTNVLFIAIDDMKPLLGCYGDAQALTPRIDSLSSVGVTFLNAQCQWAVCGPSRASLTTGLMPEETGVIGFRKIRGDAVEPGRVNSVIRPNVVTIPQHFRYHGYRTTATGKIHDPRTVGSLDLATGKVAEDGRSVDDPPSWGDPVDPANLPTNFFTHSAFVEAPGGWSPAGKPSTGATNLPDSAFADGIICDEGIGLLQNLATNDTQFFLGVGFKKPHLPFVAPQQYWDLYDRNNFSIHPFQDHPLHEVPYSWNYANELATYDDIVDPTHLPEAKQLELIHGYYACASFIDAQVGRLLDELENLNLHTNTIVVVWGDHGFHLGDHAEWGKHTNLEQAARVPFIVYSPFTGVAGNKTGTPVTFTDIYPTLCELAGLPVPEQPLAQNEAPTDLAMGRSIKGKSLVGPMNDPNGAVRVGAVTLFNRSGAKGYAYRTDRYRYIEWVKGGVVDARELYDYDADPLETVNLAGEPGFDALMYQFSVSIREEFDQFKLDPADLAAPLLQNAPVMNTATNSRALPVGLEGDQLSWAAAAGVTYDLVSTTNLVTTPWTTNQANLAQNPVTLPLTEDGAYFRIEVAD